MDRVILEAKRAYRVTAMAEYDKLMAEQSRWKLKRTIATNKLNYVRERIDSLLKQMVTDAANKGEKLPGK